VHPYIFRENISVYVSEVDEMSFAVQVILISIICIGFLAIIPLSIITVRDVKEILKEVESDEEPVYKYMPHDM